MYWSEELHPKSPYVYEWDVESIKIHFSLANSYAYLTLRISRAGDETSLVTLDDRNPIPVTAAMLGGDDGWQVGTFDLDLGPVSEDEHTLLLTVHPTDEAEIEGLPTFGWDALLLFTGLP